MINTGEQLRDSGMALAESHANAVNKDWSVNALKALITFINSGNREIFMCEDVRAFAEKKCLIEPAPNNRAWGGVIARASRSKIIKRIGYANVKNTRAHCTPASVWSAV